MKYFVYFILCFCTQISFSQTDSVLSYGENLINENKLKEAKTFYEKQLLSANTTEQEVYSLMGLAEIYKLKLDYEQANIFYVKAYDVIKNVSNKKLHFFYHVKMAEFYRKRTLFKQSVAQLDKAKLILEKHKMDDAILSKYYSRKAALFTEHFFIPDSTLYYAQKALVLAKKVKDKDGVFYSSLEIAGVYEERYHYHLAIKKLQELINFSKLNNMLQHQADAYTNYTRILIKDKQYKKALSESVHALEFANKNQLLFNEILFIDNIRNCYKKLGNIDKAFEYLETRLELTDSYYEKEHNKFLFELEEKYKLTEKENQIKINNLELANKTKELSANKTKLTITIALFVFAITWIVLIGYFLKKSKKNNKQLQSLSQENEFLLSEANHRINNNLQLVVILIADQLKKETSQALFPLRNILTKVEAISTLHKHLYKNEDKRKVDTHNYLSDVKNSFFEVFKENNIETNFTIASIKIPSDDAMYLGLLLTELCINSIKHAFNAEENKTISFTLKQKDNLLLFEYSDNGTAAVNKTIKLKLVDKICRQMDLQYTLNTANGFKFSLVKEINNE